MALIVPARLRWRCRRGTKELDMVLTRFLEEAWAELDSDDQKQFEALLEEQDPDLISWLWGDGVPPRRWKILIGKIQVASKIRR